MRGGIDQIRESPAHIDPDQPHPLCSLDLPPQRSWGGGAVIRRRRGHGVKLSMTPPAFGHLPSCAGEDEDRGASPTPFPSAFSPKLFYSAGMGLASTGTNKGD